MRNNFETDEIIADAIGESFNVPPESRCGRT